MAEHPDRAVAEATGAVVAELISAAADSPVQWLNQTAGRIREEVHKLQTRTGDQGGAWVRLALAHVEGTMRDADVCGLAVASPTESTHKAIEHPGGGLDFGLASPFEPLGSESEEISIDVRTARERAGLSEWARILVPVDLYDGRGYLQIHIDGATGAGWPRQAVLGLLAMIGPACRIAFNARVAEPLRRRQQLLEKLSPTQQELLADLLDGTPEGEIAKRLHRSKHTVHDHVKHIYRRLAVSSRLDLFRLWQGP